MDNQTQITFVRSLIRDTVLVKPQFIGANYKDVIQHQLQGRYDGACNSHGYVLSGSISIHKVSLGRVEAVSLNGDVSYDVHYFASICNPPVGSRMRVRVINMNKFGILGHGGVYASDGTFVPVVEAIVTRQLGSMVASEVNLDTVQVGDMVNIEVIGKKFELFERKIAVVARIVLDNSPGIPSPGVDILSSDLGAMSLKQQHSSIEAYNDDQQSVGSVDGDNRGDRGDVLDDEPDEDGDLDDDDDDDDNGNDDDEDGASDADGSNASEESTSAASDSSGSDSDDGSELASSGSRSGGSDDGGSTAAGADTDYDGF